LNHHELICETLQEFGVLHQQVTFIHGLQGGFSTCINSMSFGSNYEVVDN